MAKKKKLETPVIPAVEVYEQKMADANSADVANKVALGMDSLTPDDIAKSEFNNITNIPNSAAIDYTQSIADKMSKDYSDEKIAEIKKEDDIKAPVVDENVKIIDSTEEYEAPTEEMKKFEEEKTSAQWQKELYDKIFTDSEADKKKKKAAQWILAAQMLGDSIAALGNSYFTAKGANVMTLNPGTAKAAEATSQLSKDIRDAQEKAYKAKIAEVKEAYDRKYREGRDKVEDAQKAATQANWQKTFDANEAYRAQQQKNFETTEARLAEQARLNAENEKIRIDIAKQNANIQLKNALDKNKPYPMAVNGEIYEIPIKKVNEQIIGSIFAKLPEEVRMSAGQPIYGTDLGGNPIIKGYKNPSLADMLAAIGTYGNEDTAKEIMKLAGVTVEKVEEFDPKEDKREKENTSTNNTGPSIQAYSAPADEWGSQWRRRARLDTTDFSQFKRK